MKKRSLLLLLLPIFVSGSVSCSNINKYGDTIFPPDEIPLVVPSGSPTLSVYNLINKDKAEVTTSASNIPAYFSNGAYPFIVFDSTKGSTLLEKQGENARYEFDRMLTGGNFHLFAFNKNESDYEKLDIKDEDYIIGFQKDGTPDKLFRSIYDDVTICDTYFNDISSLRDKLLTMKLDYKIDKNKIDYAIVAEPAATIIKTKLTNKGLKILDINLQKEFKKKNASKRDKEFIPQAGLFVRKDIKETYKEYYNQITQEITSSIKTVLSNPNEVKTSIESKFLSAEEQVAHYGFASSIVTSVQGENGAKNGFGIVPNDVNFTKADIKNFNGLLI